MLNIENVSQEIEVVHVGLVFGKKVNTFNIVIDHRVYC